MKSHTLLSSPYKDSRSGRVAIFKK